MNTALRRRIGRLLCYAGLFTLATTANAEPQQSIELRLLNNVYSGPVDNWYWNGLAQAIINLRAPRNETVRAHLQLKTTLSSAGLLSGAPAIDTTQRLATACSGFLASGFLCLDVPYANIRVRFVTEEGYAMRLNVGRARLTWGDGSFYNAADSLFGVAAQNPDLTRSAIREETTWLLAGYFPLGRFGFIEPLLLPPLSVLTNAPLENLAAGLRVQGKVANIKGELSYLFRAEQSRHIPALSLQGNLGIDWYLSSSFVVESHAADVAQRIWESWKISLGLLHIIDLEGDSSLSLRLESLWAPGGFWEAQALSATQQPRTVNYGLFLYPEVLLSLSGGFQIFLRTIFSPIDLSALITTGIVWQPYTGLSIALFPAVQLGETQDTYHIDLPGGITVALNVSYIF